MIPKYKDIKDLLTKGVTFEAQEKIMELREAAIELQDENQELKQEIKKLKNEIGKQESVIYKKPSYWVNTKDVEDGPFCQKCFDVDTNLVRLQDGNNDIWKCKSCKSTYYGPNYKRAVVRSAPRLNRF